VDEFIYQFQSFCQFATKAKPDEITQIQAHPQAWNVTAVLNFLHGVVSKSGIVKYLERDRLGQEQKYVVPGKCAAVFSRASAGPTSSHL
jgi:hypothetical protein